MIQNTDMWVWTQDYNPIINHKRGVVFWQKLLKYPQTTPLYQLFKSLQSHLKDEENLKNDKGYLIQICMSKKTVKENILGN